VSAVDIEIVGTVDTITVDGVPWAPQQPTPIPPDPPNPPSENGMDYPKNEDELRALLQQYASEQRVGMLDGRTNVEVTKCIEIAQPPSSGWPWGVDGSYAKIRWKGGKDDVLRFIGTEGVSGRGLTVKNLCIDGGDPNLNGSGAAACLRLSAPLGDHGPLYKFNIENVFTMTGDYGFVLEGGVYEGWMSNCHAENMVKDGTWMRHMNLGAPAQGVVSNVFMVHPNMSRCFGAGIRPVYSVYIIGGSYILNGDGGVNAPDGLRGMIMSNGENTAGKQGAAFVVPNNGYGSYIDICEGSSDGATFCRRWDGTKWVDVGSPMLYLMAIGAGVSQGQNHVSYYGQPPNPMQVVAPSSRGTKEGAEA